MIKLENITKIYQAGDTNVNALNNVSLTFREKEFVSILGPSGCGKTTLLNILGGLDRYTSGDIDINGVSTKNFKDKDWDAYRNHYIGFVFQSYNLIPHLSVVENVELALSIGGTKRSEKRKLAMEALKSVGLENQAKKRPNQLSGGQMQRVAIARAIVNKPKIILADEPTGALDSETSVQIMNLLEELSKNHLIIMVTHNNDLADKYSTRIINLLDGNIVGDTMPYTPTTEEIEAVKVKENTQAETTKSTKTKKSKVKSKMNIFTAFSLSFKNLFTKKAKTFLISFAGSIGIIGIALVLSLSTGMTNYVNNLQKETLSGYPVVISSIAIDMEKMEEYLDSALQPDEGEGDQGSGGSGDGSESDEITGSLDVYDYEKMVQKLSKFNHLTPEFLTYLNNYNNSDNNDSNNLKALKVQYANNLMLVSKSSETANARKLNTNVSINALTGMSSSLFFEGLTNKDFILDNYTLMGDYPTNKNEVLFVVNSSNSISVNDLNELGFNISTNSSDVSTTVDYTTLINKEYRLLLNDDYYIPNNQNNPTAFTENTDYETLYNNRTSENTLKITGILKAKENATSEIFDSGIMYMPELNNYLIEKNSESAIVKATVINNYFYKPYKLNISGFDNAQQNQENPGISTPQMLAMTFKGAYNIDLTDEQALDIGLQMLGASTIPTNISLYTTSFNAKTDLTNYINAWNKTEQGKTNLISYTDSTAFLADTLGLLINIITYVLIAFAGISLVVSSIMIGIITYTSVIERTKEIGVLRSLGARKKDISRVFNMETFIIGLSSGLIGVIITFILTFPISSLIAGVAGGAVTTKLAVLKVSHMISLILISVGLTLIAGLVPARIASKKDPVKALRTE